MKESTAIALLAALESNARATRALTKRLNEQGLAPDAVSVITLTERAEEDHETPDEVRRRKLAELKAWRSGHDGGPF